MPRIWRLLVKVFIRVNDLPSVCWTENKLLVSGILNVENFGNLYLERDDCAAYIHLAVEIITTNTTVLDLQAGVSEGSLILA